jgi:deoxyribose-phosphate aldolase
MDSSHTEAEAIPTYESLARLIDHLLLGVDLSEDQVFEGCRLAREYGVASVVVRPSDVDQVARAMEGSPVRVASTVGYPHGSSVTGTKLYEGRDLLRRGVHEIDFVINAGKLMSRQFQYVETELLQMAKSCQESGALLKVYVPTGILPDDLKIISAKICKRVDAQFIAIDPNEKDVAFVLPLLRERVELKIASGVSSLDQALEFRRTGCSRLATADPAPILEEWKAHIQRLQQAVQPVIS